MAPLVITAVVMFSVGFAGIRNGNSPFQVMWCFVATAVLFGLAINEWGKATRRRKRWGGDAPRNIVRSGWEKKIAEHVRHEFPSLRIETNNRSIIRSRHSFFTKMEIDIWIPSIKLGIEANGERYHDHDAYNRDLQNGTCYSNEMYKEKYCKRRGIKLIHVWDSENYRTIFRKIDAEIKSRMVK